MISFGRTLGRDGHVDIIGDNTKIIMKLVLFRSGPYVTESIHASKPDSLVIHQSSSRGIGFIP